MSRRKRAQRRLFLEPLERREMLTATPYLTPLSLDVQAHYPINAGTPNGFAIADELVEGGQLVLINTNPPTISTSVLGSFGTGSTANTGRSEIAAFDPVTKRAFFTNSTDNQLGVLDVSNPAAPVAVAGVHPISLAAHGAGPNSVAVSGGIVAVAVEASPKTNPGSVVFFSTAGVFLKQVTVGALPDMLTFTPDGKKLLVANEGEPNSYGQVDSVDPVGSVSIIDLANGVANATVQTAGFTAFNGQEAALRAAGVRIFGPGSSAAQDFEPEYITVSADGTTAYVTLQENNSLATIDIATATVTSVESFGYKDHNSNFALRTSTFTNLPSIGSTAAGQSLTLGGFSGLTFTGVDPATGHWQFLTHTDRGPNGDATGVNRPFLLPSFAPRIVKFDYDPDSGQLTLLEQITLKRNETTTLTGLPNTAVAGGTASTPHHDEVAVDLKNVVQTRDLLGGDFEGIAVDADGTFWMVDEYRPAIYHFTPDGVLMKRFVPIGSAAAAGLPAGSLGEEKLPSILGNRRQNRGFEGVSTYNGKVYAIVQSPLRNPSSLSNSTLNGMKNVRLVEFDPVTETTRQFLYILDNADLATADNTRPDKIGDMASLGNGEFLMLERDDDAIDSDPASNIEKKVYRFSLTGATNVQGMDAAIDVGGGVFKTIDQMTAAELTAAGVTPLGKTLHVDLNAVGYNAVEKVEGLTVIDANTIAVINDNDFGVANIVIDNATGRFTLANGYTPEPAVLGIITANSHRLDASDRDTPGSSNVGLINIRNWPVLGMYQPDAIASYTVGGVTYLITANEGDSRNYTGFNEESRVKDATMVLDQAAFAAQGYSDVTNGTNGLRHDDNLGRLTVTNTLGNPDGDGDFDKLYAFGARSFSIWTTDGVQVFDSGDDFEQLTSVLFPANFNASNDNNNLDDRSDNKGPEPEAVAVGTVDGRTYAFIGLERIGGVMVYDVTVPHAPVFQQYLNNRNLTAATNTSASLDLGLEDVKFISASQSPTGVPLLMTANELSGTVSFFALNFAPRITALTSTAAANPALPNQTVTVSGTFTDVGPGTHAVTIDWGDGAVSAATVNEAAKTFTAARAYPASGRYAIQATLSDGQFTDGESTSALVTGVSQVGNTLLVIGTGGGDTVTIRPGSAAGTIQVTGYARGQSKVVNVTGLTSLDLVLAGGNDWLTIHPTVALNATIDAGDGHDTVLALGSGKQLVLGGAGNDNLMGGSGDGVFVGGAGIDTLIGGSGRNVLIGGADSDFLFGKSNEDLLIGGSTVFDNNRAALLALRDRWSKPDPFSSRVSALNAGIATPIGSLRLRRGITVLDDAATDLLLGGTQDDWLLTGAGDIGV